MKLWRIIIQGIVIALLLESFGLRITEVWWWVLMILMNILLAKLSTNEES